MSLKFGHHIIFAVPSDISGDIEPTDNKTLLVEVAIEGDFINSSEGFIFTVNENDPLNNLKFNQFIFVNKISENVSDNISDTITLFEKSGEPKNIYSMNIEDFNQMILEAYNHFLLEQGM